MRLVHICVIACSLPLFAAAPARGQAAVAPGAPDGSVGSPATPPPAVVHSTPTATEDQPFRRLFQNLFADAKRLLSVDTAVVVAVGGVLGAVALKNDGYLTEHASAGGTDQVFAAGGKFGSGYTQAGIALGAYAIGRIAKNRAALHIGTDLIRTQALTGLLTHTVKAVARRTRPNGSVDSATATYSFPSGHASGSFATATVLWRHLGWRVGVPSSLLATFASASRLQQNEHYLSDVLVGAAIGIASGRTVTLGHGRHSLVVAPAPAAGGAVVTFTLVTR
jgi:hypothetical protein